MAQSSMPTQVHAADASVVASVVAVVSFVERTAIAAVPGLDRAYAKLYSPASCRNS